MNAALRSLALGLMFAAIAGGRAEANVISDADLYRILDNTPQIKHVAASDKKIAGSEKPARWYDPGSGADGGLVTPELDDYGYLANGADLLIVPLDSGGSGVVFTALLYTSIHGHARYIGYVPSPGGHLEIYISEGKLVVVTPNYGSNDPNCCPSSRTYTKYTLDGIKLVKGEAFTEKLK